MNRDVCEHFNPVDLPCDKCKSANVQKSTLREAAQQALEAWDGGDTEWFKRAYTVMDALRAALVEDAMQKFTDVNQELEAALAEPEERNFCPRCGKRTNDIHTCTPP